MTTIKSLKDMYVKLGGSLTDTYADIAGEKAVGTYATIPEMIQACTKKAGSGGGKDEIFWVNAIVGDSITFDKTFAEITAAVEDGMLPIVDAMGAIEIPMVGKPSEVLGFDKFYFAAVAQVDPSEEPNIIAWALSSDDTVREVGELFATKTYLSERISRVAPFAVELIQGESGLTSNVTYGEAFAAMQSGKSVMFKIDGVGTFAAITAFKAEGNITIVTFQGSSEPEMLTGAITDYISIAS